MSEGKNNNYDHKVIKFNKINHTGFKVSLNKVD